MYMPEIIETTGRSTKGYSLPTKLLQDRIIFIGAEIDAAGANSIIMQLKWLAADKPNEDIHMYINTPGGSVYDGLAIRDIIDSISCKVNTLGVGLCASMGAYLLACGTGTRRATKNCRIMLHSVASGAQGTVHDMTISMKETMFLQERMMTDISEFTNGITTIEEIKEKTERDFYISAEEAVTIGIIDSVA